MADVGFSLENILARLQTTEEAVAKAIASLIDENSIWFLTELDDDDEVQLVLLLRIIQLVTKSSILDDFLKKYLILKVARQGKRAQTIATLAMGVGSIAHNVVKGSKTPTLSV